MGDHVNDQALGRQSGFLNDSVGKNIAISQSAGSMSNKGEPVLLLK